MLQIFLMHHFLISSETQITVIMFNCTQCLDKAEHELKKENNYCMEHDLLLNGAVQHNVLLTNRFWA